MTSKSSATDSKRTRTTKWLITIGAILVAGLHLLFPDIKIDAITIALIVVALTPWLGDVFRSIEVPGVVKIEYQELEELKENAQDVGLLSPKEGVGGGGEYSFEVVRDQDPNLALAGLRIEIERRLNFIANSHGIQQRMSASMLLHRLQQDGWLPVEQARTLDEILRVLTAAVHGAEVDPKAASWAFEIGPSLLRVLDEQAAS